MSANLSSALTLRFQDSGTGQDSSALSVSVASFAAQGCTVRGISIETQIASGSATIAIFGGPTGATVTLLDAASNDAPATAGGEVLPLTATAASLQLESTDVITVQRDVANSQNAITIYFGDYSPTAITVT
jgi:uncharacterized protein YaaW (UPF0174 family)